jgi:hypothetical protein
MEETQKTTVSKNKNGYGYKYTDLAQIHDYLESINSRYYQYVERIDNDDYIMTVPIINGEEKPARRGVKIVDAVLSGIKNPAQEQGSATTYARRYSLLMAFGLATEDDDAQSLTKKVSNKNNKTKQNATETEIISPYEFEDNEMTAEQLITISNLEEPLKEKLRNFYKKDPTKLTRLEAEQSINSLKQKGLIKSKEQIELEKKTKEEVF